MTKGKKENLRNTAHATDQKMARSLDELKEFEEFQEGILPNLRRAIKEGKSAEEIYSLVSAAAAGRLATLAIKEADPMKALALIKEVLDRSGGKAKERVDITSKYEKMSDQELDSMLLTEEAELGDRDTTLDS